MSKFSSVTRKKKQGPESGALWHLEFGDNPFRYKTGQPIPPISVKPIPPDETFQISLSDHDYGQVLIYLSGAEFPLNINEIEMRVNKIGFTDGTAWAGRMKKRDPNSPYGWSDIEPPERAAED